MANSPKRYSEFDQIGQGIVIPGDAIIAYAYKGVSYRATKTEFVGSLIPTIDKKALGLDLVDNVPDLNKPISTAMAVGLSAKANAVHSHQPTDIVGFSVAVTNVIDGWSGTAKPTDFPLINALIGQKVDISALTNYALTVTVDGIANTLSTKADKTHTHTPTAVGLGNVNNTADIDKPVSTPVQTELDKKVNISDLQSIIANIPQAPTTVSVPIVKQKPQIVARYKNPEPAAGYVAQVLASHTLFTSKNWSRSGTVINVERDTDVLNHETVAIGDGFIVYNAGELQSYCVVTALSGNVITASCTDIGAFSYTATGNANYIIPIKATFNSTQASSLTSVTLSQTAGNGNYATQLISLGLHIPANALAGTTLDTVMPREVFGTFGIGNSITDATVPIVSVRSGTDTLPAVGATIAVNQNSNGYLTYTLGALGAASINKVIRFSF